MERFDLEGWMWAEACTMLDRAERLQRQFFQPGGSGGAWQPPLDVFETESAIFLNLALPGVDAESIEVLYHQNGVVVRGERRLAAAADAVIHRLELPYGRFERRIVLRPGRFELRLQQLRDGCLTIVLEKLEQ